MASTARHKNAEWTLPADVLSYDAAQLAVLMDIRDELQALNSKLGCHRIPLALDAVRRMDRRLQDSGLVLGKRRKGRAK